MIDTAIVGAPKTGKTTLARSMPGLRRCTDEVMHEGWSQASQTVSTWFDSPSLAVVEGVAVARALRKWLAANPTGKPCRRLIVVTREPFETPTRGQASMAKGITSVLNEILPELASRGVGLDYRP